MKKAIKITLFVQCLVDGIYPEVGMAMVRIFENLGIDVDVPTEQTCCGQVAFNTGYVKEARSAASHFIDVFETADAIVCPSGSCTAMVRRHYPELFKYNTPSLKKAEAVAQKTFELSEYLVDVLGVKDLGARFDGKVTYHDSCHLLRGLGVARQPRTLINNVVGATLVEMENSDKCCGFGGAFSVKYPDISKAVLNEKVDYIIASKFYSNVEREKPSQSVNRGIIQWKIDFKKNLSQPSDLLWAGPEHRTLHV
jgi:L-lactate dehydrogenase complex protein LldE